MKMHFKQLGIVGLLSFAMLSCDKNNKNAETTTDTVQNTMVTPSDTVSTTTTDTSGVGLPVFKFQEVEYNFGNIKAGQIITHSFKFTNTGKKPLIISEVRPGCGCTTTNYTKTPVPPNGNGEIELQFDSTGKSGQQNKPVTVFSNVEGGSTIITLIGNVTPDIVAGPYKQ